MRCTFTILSLPLSHLSLCLDICADGGTCTVGNWDDSSLPRVKDLVFALWKLSLWSFDMNRTASA